MKFKQKIFTTLFLLMALFSFFGLSETFAQNFDPNRSIMEQGGCTNPPNCGWTELVNLINTIVQFLVFFAAAIAVLGFVYAGFTYLTSFGNAGKIEQAHNMFKMILIGLFFVLCGWLLVATILKIFGVNTDFSLINHNSVEVIRTP